jgi:23S rRNA (cytosine1962-C5)-methyltransferase
MVKVILKKGHEAPVIHGHPWVFSGAIAAVEGAARVGDEADVLSSGGRWLGRGLIHPDAALRVRIYTRAPGQALDENFFLQRVDQAVQLRKELFALRPDTDACRLVFAESDGLSGIVIDRYADCLSVQVDSKALLPHLGAILKRAAEQTQAARIRVKAEETAAEREGLAQDAVQPYNSGGGAPIRIRENGFTFQVETAEGQKTGFYLDQRENRLRVASYAAGRRVLSAYCYTGAFEVYCAARGAREITGLDSSERALALAARHHELNGSPVKADYRKADVPLALRACRDAGHTFDMIVLDPPRFVYNRTQLDKAMRAYKDINLLAVKLLSPGGILATFSCSGLVTIADFKKVIGWASVDASRNVRILEILSQPADHPILAVFPESEYLKGLICRID